MRSLYESISSVIDDDRVVIQNRNSLVIDTVLNAHSEFYMQWFLEENNLRLDKDTVKKIVNKLKRVLPKEALFGISDYGIPQIAKQIVETYSSVNYKDPKYACYRIEIEYALRTARRHMDNISTETLTEDIIYLTEDGIYTLDIPETKSILTELDTHFNKYTTQDEVKLTAIYKIKSKTGGKYRIYSFKDLTKEFIYKH